MSLKKLITITLTGAALALGGMGVASASLFYDASINDQGSGFGATNNILTMQLSGGNGGAGDTETGKVAWNGSVTPGVDVLSGAQVISGDNKTRTYTFGFLGYTQASDFALVWNPAETGGAGQKTSVDTLVLSIYAPSLNQSVLWSDTLAAPQIHLSTVNTGVGGNGFVYVLDPAGISSLTTFLAGYGGSISDLVIGLSSTVSFVDDGPDTWTIKVGPGGTVIPVPGTLAVLGAGLIALFGVTRRRKAQ